MKSSGEQLTLFPADSLAPTSVSPDNRPESTALNPAYGTNSLALLATFDLNTRSWRTSQRCFLATEADGLAEFSETWPRSGILRSGIVYQRPPLTRLTGETASGSLLTPTIPTPSASSYGTNQGGSAGRVGKVRPSLETMARKNLWPTPKSSPSGPDYARANRPESGGDDLATAVAREQFPTPTDPSKGGGSSRSGDRIGETPSLHGMARKGLLDRETFPTPTKYDHKGRGANSYQRHKGLDNHVKLWPTPVASDAMGSGSRNTVTSKAHPGVSLTDAVRGDGGTGRLWPTPAAHEGRLGYQDRTSGKKGTQESLTTSVMYSEGRVPSEEWSGGQLNPIFVEWLMGFPLGFTDSSVSGTQSSLKSRSSSETPSPTAND